MALAPTLSQSLKTNLIDPFKSLFKKPATPFSMTGTGQVGPLAPPTSILGNGQIGPLAPPQPTPTTSFTPPTIAPQVQPQSQELRPNPPGAIFDVNTGQRID